MKPTTPQYITGCAKHYPMLDRNGRRIKLGDRIRYQHCVGRYGQTSISEALVDKPHYQYGEIEGAVFHLDFSADVLRGYNKFDDWEHGHETWVEVIG